MKASHILTVILLWVIGVTAQETMTHEKEFSQYADGDKLVLAVKGITSIDIKGQKDRAGVFVKIAGPNEYRIDFKELGGVLHVDGHFAEGSNINGNSIEIDIELPAVFDLDIESDGGEIKIADLTGNFSGKSLGGDIYIERLTGIIDFKTNGGSISVHQGLLDGRVQTSGGNIEINEVGGMLKANSDGGQILYKNVYKKQYDGEVELTTLAGDIEIEEAPYGATVKTGGGTIFIHKASGHVNAVTEGGNIILRNIEGDIVAETFSGNIDAEILSVNGGQNIQTCQLTSRSGDVALYFSQNLKANFEVALTYTRDAKKEFKIETSLDMKLQETSDWDTSQEPARKTVYGRARTGDGKNLVRMNTVNGNISLKSVRPQGAAPINSRFSNYLTEAEIQGSDFKNAYDLISELRPQWLFRYENTRESKLPLYPSVWVNNIKRYGDVGYLYSIPVSSIKRIKYLTAIETMQLDGNALKKGSVWGIDRAILIETK